MLLVKVDYSSVQESMDHHSESSALYNTVCHAESEAPDLTIPDNAPYGFRRFLPLILRTRRNVQQIALPSQSDALPTDTLQTVHLSRPLVRQLHSAAQASIALGGQRLNRVSADDIADSGIVTLLESQLVFPPKGLFVRLDDCSPKDGAHSVPGQMALHSVDDLVLRLVTSARALNAMGRWLEYQRHRSQSLSGDLGGEGQDKFDLFFQPFDARMSGEREYRVFCRPVDGRVTGVSQYRWHKRWRFADAGQTEQKRVKGDIERGVERIHRLILEDLSSGLGTKNDQDMDALLLRQGFTFDVLYDEETRECELIELNPFGVRSNCGSCLFQWVREREVLYGSGGEKGEFRVAI